MVYSPKHYKGKGFFHISQKEKGKIKSNGLSKKEKRQKKKVDIFTKNRRRAENTNRKN